MRVTLLGTGGALTSARRGNTSILLEGDRPLLVDCPADPPRAILQCGGSWQNVDDVLLTHRHPDHVAGVVSLVLQRYISERPGGWGPLRLYGPRSALTVARRLLETVELFERDDLFPIEMIELPLEPSRLEVGDLDVMTAPAEHGATEVVAVRVASRAGSGAVVYSADTRPCDAVLDLSRGASLLIHECSTLEGKGHPSHTSLDQVDDLAERTDAQRIVLVHLPPVEPVVEGRVRRRLAEQHGGKVRLGEDGAVYEV